MIKLIELLLIPVYWLWRRHERKVLGKYYTPKHIAYIASGSGAFLKEAADDLTKNPPYSGNKNK